MENLPKSRRRKLRFWILDQNPAMLHEKIKTGVSRPLIDLASNDYFGLSRHPKLKKAAEAAMDCEGVGAGGSRLVTGSRLIHKKLEARLSEWLGRDQVLLFPSGFQANIAAVIALAGRETPVIADKLIHHSLIVGIKASGAKLHRYRHNDLKDLEKHLKKCKKDSPHKIPLVITESLFSMEGTCPDLKKIEGLCVTYNAKLFVDEAHALGVMGKEGRGLCYGLSQSIEMISGTFGKAFGCGGAFLATNNNMAENLLQNCGGFRYTTALAPPITAAALEALNLIQSNPEWGEHLQEKSRHWRRRIEECGWTRPPGYGQIISLVIGSDSEALSLQNQLERKGIICVAIRPPTVPERTSRLRITLQKDIPDGTLATLIQILSQQ